MWVLPRHSLSFPVTKTFALDSIWSKKWSYRLTPRSPRHIEHFKFLITLVLITHWLEAQFSYVAYTIDLLTRFENIPVLWIRSRNFTSVDKLVIEAVVVSHVRQRGRLHRTLMLLCYSPSLPSCVLLSCSSMSGLAITIFWLGPTASTLLTSNVSNSGTVLVSKGSMMVQITRVCITTCVLPIWVPNSGDIGRLYHAADSACQKTAHLVRPKSPNTIASRT